MLWHNKVNYPRYALRVQTISTTFFRKSTQIQQTCLKRASVTLKKPRWTWNGVLRVGCCVHMILIILTYLERFIAGLRAGGRARSWNIFDLETEVQGSTILWLISTPTCILESVYRRNVRSRSWSVVLKLWCWTAAFAVFTVECSSGERTCILKQTFLRHCSPVTFSALLFASNTRVESTRRRRSGSTVVVTWQEAASFKVVHLLLF